MRDQSDANGICFEDGGDSLMQLTIKIHEWLADHVSWIQYPNVTMLPERRRFRFRDLTWKQRWWVAFALFWGSVILVAVYGSFI